MSSKIDGNVGDDSKQVAIGEHNRLINIYSDTHTWRLDVQQRLDVLHREIVDLRGWARGLLIAICIAFALGFMASLLALRQFDIQSYRLERNIDRIERLEQRVIPLPFTPIP